MFMVCFDALLSRFFGGCKSEVGGVYYGSYLSCAYVYGLLTSTITIVNLMFV